ncbi:MAG TPA: prenyltransferase/squalene oxidase repeat-containing protein [Planctomycetota bacterium]|nr:prenyltransferase/squalene oxidase repeat-containing protein [Planctomycetota bacterium]
MSHEELPPARVESTLPKSWEVERTFNDALYEWMARAPWLAISAAAHGLVILVVLMIPWKRLEKTESKPIRASIEQAPEDLFEDPRPREEPVEIQKEPLEEPVLEDAAISDHNETDDGEEIADVMGSTGSIGEPDLRSDTAFEGKGENGVIGIRGDVGGKYGERKPGHRNLKTSAGVGTEVALEDGLQWLKWHQSADGSWDCDGFMANCGHIESGSTCGDPGEATHDVGMTGLALLAFLGDGSTTVEGKYKEQVAKAVKWMKDRQDQDTGLYGEKIGHLFMYDHAIATLAMCETYYFSRNPLLKHSAQDAIDFISRSRNPYSAWRYSSPAEGENDTSVTGWCVFAMASAREGGLEIDEEGFVGAKAWIDRVTDPATGRTGYNAIGSPSSRLSGRNDQYPPERGEAMTSVAILSRVFMGEDIAKSPIVDKGADLLKMRLPEWDPSGHSNDIYYWYYGSYALFQLGGLRWDAWNRSAKKALVEHQRHDGDQKGSWDPKDAWGHAGGRVYMSALAVLCLEVYFRYSRVLGGR